MLLPWKQYPACLRLERIGRGVVDDNIVSVVVYDEVHYVVCTLGTLFDAHHLEE